MVKFPPIKQDPSTPPSDANKDPMNMAAAVQNTDLYGAAQAAAANVGQAPSGPGNNANPTITMFSDYYNRQVPTGDILMGDFGPRGGAGTPIMGTSKTYTQSEVLDFYWRFNVNEKASLDAYISRMGGDPSKMSSIQKADVWADLVAASVYYQRNGKPTFDPWAVAMMEMWGDDKDRSKPKTTTSTSKVVDLTNRADAEAILYQASRTLLGRAPTADETTSFLNNLNSTEKANPTVTTTTTTTAGTGEVTNQDVQRSGGVSDAAKAMQAQKESQANPEYGAYQAATTYYNDFMSMIKGG